jgi:8-oxo-dGTP diphosphatase
MLRFPRPATFCERMCENRLPQSLFPHRWPSVKEMIREVVRSVKRILFAIYKHLPKLFRWRISYALSSKFLVGMTFFVEKDGRLLLVRHAYQKAWSLPGGWLKKGETIEEGARREIKEEFGASITGIQTLKIEADKSKPVIDIAVGCRFVEPPKADQIEIQAFDFFNVGSLPPEIIHSQRAHIDEYIRQRTTNLQKGTA